MQKWEYCMVTSEPLKLEPSELNKLGARGWELVSVVGTKFSYARLTKFTYFFKRSIVVEER